ncbi:MAG: hypothetical protein Q9225_000828 [Loekoesia sp. 1 TL-2023]
MTVLSFRLLLLYLLLQHLQPCEAPTLRVLPRYPILEDQWEAAASRIASQWQNPNDVLTVLLIIGGDIVQKALAQLSGGRFVPVAFSFGWVSYSFNALLTVFGDGALMPPTIHPSILVNTRSGYARLNYSWILNRMLRGLEHSLEPLDAALCVSVFRSRPHNNSNPRDWLWWSGVITILVQLTLAIIPYAINSDWTILSVTLSGIGLALSGGLLPQWRKEKWGARPDSKKTTFCLTRGNGFQHVVVIQNQTSDSLNLEDLAMPRRDGCSRSCKVAAIVFALLWIAFLINVASTRNNTWYLLGVGFLGMIQNISVAAVPRRPDAMGLPLEFVTKIQGPKVMAVLMNTERQFPFVGLALVKIFFPGDFSPAERQFWANKETEKMAFTRQEPAVFHSSIVSLSNVQGSHSISLQPFSASASTGLAAAAPTVAQPPPTSPFYPMHTKLARRQTM